MFLPDVNVWLALTFDSHVHHADAKKWFDALSREICFFCRMTQQGFLRLATSPVVFKHHALTLAQAWQKYDAFQSDARVSYVDEPAGVETPWRNWTKQQTFSPHVWNDAYLAAFALSASLEMSRSTTVYSVDPAAATLKLEQLSAVPVTFVDLDAAGVLAAFQLADVHGLDTTDAVLLQLAISNGARNIATLLAPAAMQFLKARK